MALHSSKQADRRAYVRAQGRLNPNLAGEIRDRIASAEAARRNAQLQLQGERKSTASKSDLRDRIRSCERTISILRGQLAALS